MGNFLGPLSYGDDGLPSKDGSLAENQNQSTTSHVDRRVTTGFELEPDNQEPRQNMLARGYNGDTGQDPILQGKGWQGDVSSNYVDDNYNGKPLVGNDFSTGPDQQGQMLRGYVLNGPDVTAHVEMEGNAAQKGPMYVPRITTLYDPNTDPAKGR